MKLRNIVPIGQIKYRPSISDNKRTTAKDVSRTCEKNGSWKLVNFGYGSDNYFIIV